MNDLQIFIAKHQDEFTPEPNSGCWLWISTKTAAGYGRMRENGKEVYAHRAMFSAAHGPMPPGHSIVRHKCDTPACVNPYHLESGTMQDNTNDMCSRGRSRALCGSENPRSVLSEREVGLIRDALRAGTCRHSLAAQFGVDASTISGVGAGYTWKHVAVPTVARKKMPTESLIREIKAALGTAVQTELARRFGVSQSLISAIKTGRNWGHLT